MDFKIGDEVYCIMDGKVLYTAIVIALEVPNDVLEDPDWENRILVKPIHWNNDTYDEDTLQPVKDLVRKVSKLEKVLK